VLIRLQRLMRAGIAPATAARSEIDSDVHANGVSTDPSRILDAAYRPDADAALDMLDACRRRHGAAATSEQVCRPALAGMGADGWDGRVDVEHVLSWAITACLHRASAHRSPRQFRSCWRHRR
jgi:hypothetical protein